MWISSNHLMVWNISFSPFPRSLNNTLGSFMCKSCLSQNLPQAQGFCASVSATLILVFSLDFYFLVEGFFIAEFTFPMLPALFWEFSCSFVRADSPDFLLKTCSILSSFSSYSSESLWLPPASFLLPSSRSRFFSLYCQASCHCLQLSFFEFHSSSRLTMDS